MIACGACGQENPQGARFCLACATPLAAPPPERRKLATLIFCDVTGSTALGERVDAETVREVMRAYFDQMRIAIEQHGGTVEKFIGDAVVAVFGVPVAHEDDALRAVRAAWEMRRRLETLNQDLERRHGTTIALRIGINSGEVVAGDASTRQALVTGDAVNVAARLEQAAPPGEILLGEGTERLVRGSVSAVPLEPLAVKGKAEPLRAFRLTDVGQASARRRLHGAPMVGREAELAFLRARLADAASGRPTVETVIGEPGVGKSRLASEVIAGLAEFRILTGRCLEYGEGITYWPIAEIVRQAAGIDDDLTRAAALARIEAIATPGHAAVIAQAIGVGEGEAGSDEIARSFASLLRSLAGDRPLLVFVDDIHWAEPTLLELLASLPTALESAPVAVLCLARPELLEDRPDWTSYVRLAALSEGDSTALVGQLLGRGTLPAELSARIAEAAAGNPLFVEELVGMLVDERFIERANGAWRVVGDVAAIAIPTTLRELLGARLDRLPPDQRSGLERGAVEGQVFHGGAVAALSDEARRVEVPVSLRALEEREVVLPASSSFAGEPAYRIRHILIRDAAYEAIPKRLRAEWHERFAAWLADKAADRLSEYDEILGYHLERAFRYREELGPVAEADRPLAKRAAERLIAAGHRAFARRDAAASVNLYSRAAALLPRLDPARLELLRPLAHMLMDAFEFDRSRATLAELEVDAMDAGDERVAAEARLLLAVLTFAGDPEFGTDGLTTAIDRSAPVFELVADEPGRARVNDGRAFVYDQARQSDASEREAEQALAIARRIGDRNLEFEMSWWLFWALPRGPRPVEEAIARCQDLRTEFAGDQAAEGTALYALAQLESMRGRFEDARRCADSGAATMEELGLMIFVWRTMLVHAFIDLLAGDPIAAERAARGVYDIVRPVGDLETLSSCTCLLAQALLEQGRLDEAEAMTGEAEAASPRGSAMPQVTWRFLRAVCWARSGRSAAAVELAQEAVRLAEHTDDLNLKAHAQSALAEVLAAAGRVAEANGASREAVALFERKGNVVSAERARLASEQLDRTNR